MLKHGLYGQRIYRIYKGMKERCNKSYSYNYKHYGARGIKVCDEWMNDFINFYNWSMENGYTEDLTLDRIDVDGNYEPNNCRWITNVEQQNNRRNNIKVLFDGRQVPLLEVAEELNMSFPALKARICRYGWSVEKALSTPIKSHTNKLKNKEKENERKESED